MVLVEAGLPADVLNVVHGKGSVVREALGHDKRVAALSFTGSTRVSLAPWSGVPRGALELITRGVSSVHWRLSSDTPLRRETEGIPAPVQTKSALRIRQWIPVVRSTTWEHAKSAAAER